LARRPELAGGNDVNSKFSFNMIFVITEKPQTAEMVATNRGASSKRDGYFEGNGYVVTSAFGHLTELLQPDEYNEKYRVWSLEDLPIIPDFKYKVHAENYRKARFKLISSFLPKASSIVNACDPDAEGENIFWQIINLAGFRDIEKCKRLWVDDFNDGPLTIGFNKLRPLAEFKNEYLYAETRQKADWLFGMNVSRLLTKSAQNGLWNFGRVQTPTLMMVCEAFKKHNDFIETPFWKVEIVLESSIPLKVISESSYTVKAEAEAFCTSMPTSLLCTDKVVEERREKAPDLFNLDALQQASAKNFGLKLDQTLDAAQALYEKHRLTTYPRTDSRHLPESLRNQVLQTISLLSGIDTLPPDIVSGLKVLSEKGIQEGAINDSKVSAHYAIIPTMASPKGKELSRNEGLVYLLIIKQFVQAFLKPCIKEITTLQFEYGNNMLQAKGVRVLQGGWRKVESALDGYKPKGKDSQNQETEIPSVEKGDTLKIRNKAVTERKTQKPPLLTIESLSKLMATAGKLIEDEVLAETMKGQGIGTSATRAGIVKRLYELEFIADQGNSIIPTKDGLELFSVMDGLQIASPELTGVFESKLQEIIANRKSPGEFLKEAIALMLSHMELLKEKAKVLQTHKFEKEEIGEKCPLCGEGEVVIGKNTYLCSKADWAKQESGWINSGCTFQIQKTIAGKVIKASIVKEIITTGTSKLIKGFNGKEEKTFAARLQLKEGKVVFVFETAAEIKGEKVYCPKCKTGELILNQHGVFCSEKDACDFKLWRKVAGKELSDAVLTQLLQGKKTALIKGFKKKDGGDFSAHLVLTETKLQFTK